MSEPSVSRRKKEMNSDSLQFLEHKLRNAQMISVTRNNVRIIKCDVPQFYGSNLQYLKDQFDRELLNSSVFNKTQLLKNSELFYDVAFSVAQLPFKKSDVELLSDNIKFSFLFDNEIMVMISRPLDALEDVQKDQIIFSIFKKRELIFSNVATPSIFVEVFKEYLLSAVL